MLHLSHSKKRSGSGSGSGSGGSRSSRVKRKSDTPQEKTILRKGDIEENERLEEIKRLSMMESSKPNSD